MRVGPIAGLSGWACELMRHLGYDPDEHPDTALDIEAAIGVAMLDIGREILAEQGSEVRDPVGLGIDPDFQRTLERAERLRAEAAEPRHRSTRGGS
jgi:hypothetical protein